MTDQIKKKPGKSNNKQKAVSRQREKKGLEILFFRLGETEFCARKDDLIDISGGNIIYRLPLTPAYFDGVVDLKGATTYVFDLAALVGITSSTSVHEGTLLIISKESPPAAFRVDELSGVATIKNEAIIPIPAYLKSEFIDACAIHEERLIPIINLNIILKSILSKRIEATAKLSLSSPAKDSKKKLSKENLKLFILGKETFAALDFDPSQPLFKLSDIAVIPGTPDFVLGITLFQEQALTIIDTSLRLNSKKSVSRKVLTSKIGRDLFGFIVDAEKKHKTIKIQNLELPLLTRKKWMTSAIFTGKEIIPILKLSSLLFPEEPVNKERLAKSYRPNHSFEQSFFKKKVDITELILMGKHHALPATEVKEVISLKGYRNLPGLPSIVIGVSEHNGALLPVIDIEACFGIKSEMTKSWKMIHLENGDFSALVITKAAFDEKELPPELHRKIPLIMKHRFLYGCYPNNEEKMISLALNVYKMAVYFDEEMLREIFKNHTSRAKEDKRITAGEPPSTQSDMSLNAADNLNDQAKDLGPWQDPISSAPATTEQEGDPETLNKEHDALIDTERDKTYQVEQPGEGLSTGDEQEKSLETIQGPEEKIEEPDPISSEETFHTDPDLSINPLESSQHSFSPDNSNITPNASDVSKKLNTKNSAYIERLEPNKSKAYIWIALSVFLLLCIALFLLFSPDSDSIKKDTSIKSNNTTKNNPAIEEKAPPAEKKESDHVTQKTAIAGQAGVKSEDYLMKTEAIESKNNPTAKNEKPSKVFIPVELPKPANKEAMQTVKPKKWKRNKNKYYPPLGEFDFYTVEDGDTLWDIAEAYSKNPYDYNLVAEDNKIIDPDLIYPGQRLRLQKKLKVDKTTLPEQNKTIP